MTIEQIDKLARKKADTDKTVTLLETGLYYQLRSLYEAFDNDKMTADEAKAEKERIIKQYEEDYTAISDYAELIKQNGELKQTIEQHQKIFYDDDRRRVAISGLLSEANKNGCEMCKKIVMFYDGRL